MKRELLMELIDRSGLKKQFIAERLGITYQAFLNKIDGSSEFKISEAAALKVVIDMSDAEFLQVFVWE